MTEIKKIQRGLAQDGRQAYEEAKSNNNAFILIGNSIYRIGADGSREMVKTLPSNRIIGDEAEAGWTKSRMEK